MKNLRKTAFLLPFFLLINLYESDSLQILGQEEISIQRLIEKNSLDFEDIPNLVIDNNLEMKALKELINSSSLNLASKISEKYPVPTNLLKLVKNEETGFLALKIVEIIGEDEVANLDSETIYFITNLLNRSNLIKLRNEILLSALPQRT